MEIIKIENLNFKYPNSEKDVLCDINLSVFEGEFITVCGKSGCGKTTLLRLLKPSLSPVGRVCGNIFFDNKKLCDIEETEQVSKIGFVMQSPENQIVTDKVWHELAFGLESLGFSTPEIRARVSEMASFFGISNWFHKNVTELSGGQKQLLNLASVMVMQPSVLILDEPTSQLDPIAAQEFLNTLKKINQELGTTVIITEHRLEEAFSLSDRVVVIDDGKVICNTDPKKAGRILKELNHDMFLALPAPMRIYGAMVNEDEYPLTVREGRNWIEEYSKTNKVNHDLIFEDKKEEEKEIVIELKDVWFRYEKKSPDIIKGMSVKVKEGQLFSILGGNGTGKTTALSVISGLNVPYRGSVLIKGEKITDIPDLYNGVLGVLPQNPQSLFVKKTVYSDLLQMLDDKKESKQEKEEKIKKISVLCRIQTLLERHPYDLSGGEQQRAALAKILLKNPEILLLDEPTKGMDSAFKEEFSDILAELKENGVSIIMVSHDIEFCAKNANCCALMFDGIITSQSNPREFFCGKNFYTTSANRMARTTIPNAVLTEDIILALGGNVAKKQRVKIEFKGFDKKEGEKKIKPKKTNKISPIRVIFGCVFLCLFILTCVFGVNRFTDWRDAVIEIISIIEIFITFLCFLPKKEKRIKEDREKKSFSKRNLFSLAFILVFVPLTVFFGTVYLNDRKYYFISLLIILETLIPFFISFENKKPTSRELVLISAICAITVAGRAAFYMLPQFKPVTAIVIITGICFGGETGFLVGAVSAFVSNFFFGQGPWTPWQMVTFGLIGLVSGVFFKKRFFTKDKINMSIFGAFSTFIIYAGIMNLASVILYQENINMDMVLSSYIMGFPFDMIHVVSTVFFLWIFGETMIEKLERVKIKYGMINL